MATPHKLSICLVMICVVLAGLSCNRQPTDKGTEFSNQLPDTFFAPTPLNGSMNNPFKLRLEWHGNESDGILQGYEYRVEGPLFDNTWQFTEDFHVDFKFRNGWYTVEVRSVDNKGAVDPTPAKLRLHVLGPTFHKSILFVDDDQHSRAQEAVADSYYDTLFTAAGYPNYAVWDYREKFGAKRPVFVAASGDTDATGQPVDALGSYTTVVWVTNPTGNLGLNKSILQDYLDMGGNLWIAGIDPIESLTGENGNGGNVASSGLAFKYFRVLRAKSIDLNVDWILSSSGSLPDLRTALLVPNTTIMQYTRGELNQLVPLFDATPLFEFNHNYYRDTARNLQVNSEELAGTPCALYYSGPVFRTAFFGFPLVYIANVGRVPGNLVDAQAMTQVVRFVLEEVFKEPKS